jgi:hypothetical protein
MRNLKSAKKANVTSRPSSQSWRFSPESRKERPRCEDYNIGSLNRVFEATNRCSPTRGCYPAASLPVKDIVIWIIVSRHL